MMDLFFSFDNKIKIKDLELTLTSQVNEFYEFDPEKSKEEKVESWLLKVTKNCQKDSFLINKSWDLFLLN
jgi:hypothetical protein